MTVALTDFLAIAAIVTELVDAIHYFKERGKQHNTVRIAAEKYRTFFEKPDFAKFLQDARTAKIFIFND